ncbi:MAG TPA: hypothetical protein VFQ60_02985 [Patescibacteria group bacterium]|nr:hypothetical protein [Patescibacteria group bacterium]
MIHEDQQPTEEKLGLAGNETKFALARRVIHKIREQLEGLELLLDGAEANVDFDSLIKETNDILSPVLEKQIIEGVFDGENMVGEDGKQYSVPPNYASKSKLVEGDLLRLTIDTRGRFIFKQRGPIDRLRLMGTLSQDDQTQNWYVLAEGRRYRLLGAAVSYFKGEPNDEAVVLIPKGAPSKWAAVENIIKKNLAEGKWE